MCNDTPDRYTSSNKDSVNPDDHDDAAAEPVAPLPGEVELARRIAAAAPDQAKQAEAELYRRLAPRVRLYGRKHLRDDHAAADLAQQVLLMLIQKIRAGELREPERVISFVFGICRMVTMDIRRAHIRRERLLQQYGEDLMIADAAVAPQLDRERLAGCLERLPERERSVVLMTFYEDKQADEVAALLGLTAGNVRVIRHRAIGRLRDCVTGGTT
jgi:RNA polymerase sigma-70 factor (ECF subfamily)